MVMKRIQHGLQYVESMLYSLQSDRTKIGGVSLIHNTSYFLYYDWFLASDLTLSHYDFETEARSPKPKTFSESWVFKDSVGTSPDKFSRWKFSGTGCFSYNNMGTFIYFLPILSNKMYEVPAEHIFLCNIGKKCCGLVCARGSRVGQVQLKVAKEHGLHQKVICHRLDWLIWLLRRE